jgi:DNA-binding MarR family transcriptional regulator
MLSKDNDFTNFAAKLRITMPARTVYLIKRIETEVTAKMNKALTEYDVTLSQFIVLNFVNDNPNDLSSAQLSRRFNMTPQSMNEVVTTLQRKELIEKNVDADNKRILRISLTDKGLDILNQCNEKIDAVEKDLFGGLPNADLQTLRGLIGSVLTDIRSK